MTHGGGVITGAEVRRLREKMKLTQEDVAALLGTSQAKQSVLERRDRVTGLEAHVWSCARCRKHFFRAHAMLDET